MSDSENTMHDANRKGWDADSAKWQANIDARMDWRRVPENIRLVLDEEELKYIGDVTDLHGLQDDAFDLVYTGGHVAVWVSDLKRYYGEGCRILKPGGLFMINEYHPIRRLWRLVPGPLKQEFGYFDHGPFEYDRSEDLPDGASGPLPSYEFHWTIADMTCALLDGGCELLALREYGDESQGWEGGAVEAVWLYFALRDFFSSLPQTLS